MSSWKRDFASGLVVVTPLVVILFVLSWLYGRVAGLPFVPELAGLRAALEPFGLQAAARPLGVVLTVAAFLLLVLAVGYLMRTTAGDFFEGVLDAVMNQLPGLRVIYNASKMAVETAVGTGTDDLQTPVKLEVWDGLRMTAFKTGRTTDDGRDVLFLPTSPNITTGFVVEVDSSRYDEIDETVEDALTRVLSAGFGDADKRGIPIDVVDERERTGGDPDDEQGGRARDGDDRGRSGPGDGSPATGTGPGTGTDPGTRSETGD